MNIADHRWLRQREDVPVIQQVFGRILESASANVRFGHAIGPNCGTHRSIDDRNSALEDFVQRMFGACNHVSLTTG